MKKVKEIAMHVLIGIIILLIQIYIFNDIRFFGAKINIILIYISITAIFKNLNLAIATSIVMGTLIDVLFKAPLFKYIAIYLVISIVINLTISEYRKESKLALIYIIGISTIAYEVVEYIFYALNQGVFVDFLSFLGIIIASIFCNVIIGIVVHKLYKTLNFAQNS